MSQTAIEAFLGQKPREHINDLYFQNGIRRSEIETRLTAALSALTQGGVKVKELEWVEKNPRHHVAECLIGAYGIVGVTANRNYRLYRNAVEIHCPDGYYWPLEAARAAAQADYNASILPWIEQSTDQLGPDGIRIMSTEETPDGGKVVLSSWPEGYVLRYHGEIVWRSWSPALSTTLQEPDSVNEGYKAGLRAAASLFEPDDDPSQTDIVKLVREANRQKILALGNLPIASPTLAHQPVTEGLEKALEQSWISFCEANPDDLTSPEELPDHALMTCEQFVNFALAALKSEGRNDG